MKNKKITIFSINLDVGGIEKYVATTANILIKNNDVEIICTYRTRKNPAFEIDARVKIKYLINEKPDDVSIKSLVKSFEFISIFKEILRRVRLKKTSFILNKKEVINCKSDIIITTRIYHNRIVNKYNKNKNNLKIATEHNSLLEDKNYIRKVISSTRKFNYLLVGTDELFKHYNNLISKPLKCVKMPYAIDKIPAKKSDFNNKNIISVGRMSPEKGFLDLIDVMRIIVDKDKEVKLFLAGDGYQFKEIEKKVKELNLEKNIILLGFKNHDELKEYYLKSSLFIMTSILEAFGLVLIEAMSYGVPCISFDTAVGPREVLKDDIGLLVTNRNKEVMANRIISLLNNKKRLKEYQRKINIEIEKYSIENSIDFWKNF